MELSRQSLSELPKGPFTATKLWNEIVSQLKVNLQVKRRRWRMKQYDDVFVASEAVDWLHDYLKENPNFGPSVGRHQAVQLCKKFLSHNIIVDARGKSFNTSFEDNSHLYRFVDVRYSPYKRASNTSRVSLNNSDKRVLSKTQSCDFSSSLNESPKFVRRSFRRSFTKIAFSNAPSRTPLGPITNKMNIAGSIKSDSRAAVSGGMKKKLIRRESGGDVIMNPAALGFQSNRRSLTEKEINEIWWDITVTRVCNLLEMKCSPEDFKGDHYDTECVRENADQQGICKASEVVPPWLLSAMKCLVQWPTDNGNTSSFPKYPGFERDVFRAVVEHFDSFPDPLVDSSILPLFIKTAGVIARCKPTALKSIQYCCMLLQHRERNTFQVLNKLMVKLVQNTKLILSDELPTKELLIQAFGRCIFGKSGDMDVIRLLYFMMENFPDCFTQPDGLKFQVEQRVLFLQSCRGKISTVPQQQGTTFCERVTMQEYAEDGLRSSQKALRDLLDQIVEDESLSDKERKKKFKQFEKSYPDIYYAKFPKDNISTSSGRKSDRLRNIIKPLGVLKNLR